MAYFVEETNANIISCSIQELCKESGMSDNPLKKALRILKEKNFISKLSKNGTKGVYGLNIGIPNGKKEAQPNVNTPAHQSGGR